MYRPFNIGTKLRIIPPGTSSSADGRIDLVMQRGAFGSGEHETTVSCLECLVDVPEINGANVLDLGSGTGILAIAALRFGAASAVCVDIDPQAVETARINCRLNQLDEISTHVSGTLADVSGTGFEVVLANIYGDILLEVADALTAKLKSGGILLLSGILWEYNFDVRQAYQRNGCEVLKNSMLDEFSTLLMRKA
jgi:ribosomal protein L11 methyltransferase